MPIQRPCIECRTLTTATTRCPTCQGKRQSIIDALRAHKRHHYKGDYATRAKHIRDTATHCYLCGKGPLDNDPFQADHVFGPDDPTLAAAHRSCNIRKHAASLKPN